MSWLESTPAGPVLSVHVVPRASKTQLGELMEGAIKIRLREPPVEGKANKALLKFLAKILGVSGSAAVLLSGETARRKRVLIRGVTAEEVRNKLQADVNR